MTINVTVAKATRHACINGGYPHTSGDGAPKRKRCAYCGGSLYTSAGTWGVFVWTGDGRYPLDNAVCTFTRQTKADAYATATRPDYVVRWVSL